jgi:hypothetical protein
MRRHCGAQFVEFLHHLVENLFDVLQSKPTRATLVEIWCASISAGLWWTRPELKRSSCPYPQRASLLL